MGDFSEYLRKWGNPRRTGKVNSVQLLGRLLAEGSCITYLIEHIPDLVFFPLTVILIRHFIRKRKKLFFFQASETLLNQAQSCFEFMCVSLG